MAKKNESARSWFCVLNNPKELFGDVTPEEMVNSAIEMWCEDKPQRSCAVNYEIGDTGNHHMHMVLEDPAKVRFSAIQKLFKGMHIEPTRGNKEQANDYIQKKGSFEEKSHTVVVPAVYRGTIKANQGARKDLDIIQELLEQGMTPNEIMDMDINYRKHEALIRKQFFRKRLLETPTLRMVKVVWHVGESGSGKTNTYTQLVEQHGKDNVYLMTDYDNGGFDNYCAEPILFMDEFKGNFRFQTLLNYLDKYPVQVHCRYANAYALWNEVHITSVFPPEEAYRSMVEPSERDKDKIDQLFRRITTICYHYKENGEFKVFELPMAEYKSYHELKVLAHQSDFIPLTGSSPFDE
ncbi:MAG: hypothetical protein IKB96_06760 [Prevotella sp.]|nr:hypothetical protein [Prevotella sp.]